MPYTFRVIFSGPCFYIPNFVQPEDDKTITEAKSWSVILPNIKKGRSKDFQDKKYEHDISITPHHSVLVYDTEHFCAGSIKDLVFNRKDGKPKGVLLLENKQISIGSKKNTAVTTNRSSVDRLTKRSRENISNLREDQLKSLCWLPSMGDLAPDMAWFGDDDKFFTHHGYPDPGNGYIAAHVLLKTGHLYTHTISGMQENVPLIWQFRPAGSAQNNAYKTQAVAYEVALEILEIEDPLSITLSGINSEGNPTTQTLTVKGDLPDNTTVTVEIKNRELQEIFLSGEDELAKSITVETEDGPKDVDVDIDFRVLYEDVLGYGLPGKEYPLAHRVTDDESSGGGERATCGGTKLQGFSSLSNAKAFIDQWEA